MKVSLSPEDALCRSRWIIGVYQIAAGLRLIQTPSVVGILPDFCWVEENPTSHTCWDATCLPLD